MTYHIVIEQERRKADAPVPEDIAARRYSAPVVSMNNDLRVQNGVDAKGMPKYTVTARPAQLHTIAQEVTDMSNIIYCAEWDGRANWLIVHKGNIADLKLAYMGWPMEDQATYDARMAEEP